MPTVKTIDTIKIDVYSEEHPPPHFHAKFAEFEELIEIETWKLMLEIHPEYREKK